MEKKKVSFQVIMGAVMLLITAAIVADGLVFHKLKTDALSYPLFCAMGVALCCIAEIIKGLKSSAKGAKDEKPVHKNMKNFLIAVGMFSIYALLMWLFGFIVASIVLTFAFLYVFKSKKILWVGLGASIVIVAIYFSFAKILYIFLPKGVLFNLIF